MSVFNLSQLVAQLSFNLLVDGLLLNNRRLGFLQVSCQVLKGLLPLLALRLCLHLIAVLHLDDLGFELDVLGAQLLERVHVHISLRRQVSDLALQRLHFVIALV